MTIFPILSPFITQKKPALVSLTYAGCYAAPCTPPQELMYSDPARYSCMFQSYVQLTMMENHTARIEQPVRMMERSIHSGRYPAHSGQTGRTIRVPCVAGFLSAPDESFSQL